jgi:hypothetical protein
MERFTSSEGDTGEDPCPQRRGLPRLMRIRREHRTAGTRRDVPFPEREVLPRRVGYGDRGVSP